jgi:chromosome segregation ATPase
MNDISENTVVDTIDILRNLTPSKRYYVKNRERIIQKNKERVLNKYHQSETYLKNEEKRTQKKAFKEQIETLKRDLEETIVKIAETKHLYNELRNKEFDLRNKLQDILHNKYNQSTISIDEPIID